MAVWAQEISDKRLQLILRLLDSFSRAVPVSLRESRGHGIESVDDKLSGFQLPFWVSPVGATLGPDPLECRQTSRRS